MQTRQLAQSVFGNIVGMVGFVGYVPQRITG